MPVGYNQQYFPVSYQPYQQVQPQYFQPQMQMPPVQQQNTPVQAQSNPSSIIWVSGERAALEYPVGPNGAVALWDSANPVIYLKQADASGKPSTKIFDLVERVETPKEATGVDVSHFADKSDVAALAGVVSTLSKDIDAIKEEMGNLASQAVKRAVGAKTKKEPTVEDED